MEKEELKWEQAAAEEQEEEETALLVRKSRTGNDNKSTEIASVVVEGSNGTSASNGHAIQSKVAANGDKNKESIIGEEQKIEELDGMLENESKAIDGELKSENLIFYDKVEGVESTSAHFGEKQIVKDPGHSKFDVSSLDFVVQNNSTSAINNRYEGDLENDSLSSSNLQPSQISFQEHSTSYKSSTEIESAEDDLINGDDLEVTELDVERVLKKQTTHDLYCPNCNSCITRRVILHKRKRRIRISDEEVKRNKIEAAGDYKLGTGSVQSPSDQVHHADEVGFGDTEIPAADDNERDRGPDIFRCLSCFSFFIPIGNGFKLFRIFGEKSGKENVSDEQLPSVKKNWFTSMFASNKQETTVEQGSSIQTDVRRSDVGSTLSSNLGDQNGQPSFLKKDRSPAHASEGLVGTAANNDAPEGREKILPFPMEKPSLNGKVLNGARDRFYTTGTETIDKEAIHQEPTSVSVLKASDQDGKLNISVAIPHEEQDVRATILTESLVENKNTNFRSSDSDKVYSTEVSQHITKEAKIEFRSSESLKVDSFSAINGGSVAQGKDTVITIDARPTGSFQPVQSTILPTETALQLATQTSIADRGRTEARKEFIIEVIKSIVYGGLAESITSLSVVSSAAGGNAGTLNILALGMANLIGGLFVICHNLWELRCDRIEQVANQISNQVTEQRDRYKELLGRRENFILHAIVAIISYLIFGLVPPVVYGFSFRKCDDKQLKLLVVAAASLLCIVVLAIGKAYIRRTPKPYVKSVVTFVVLGFMVSGVSYAAGVLVERLLEKLGLFQTSAVSNLLLHQPIGSAWASY